MQNNNLLIILQKNGSSWITSKTLAVQLGVTERTVKNRIKKLREEGYNIKSGPLGYQYESNNNYEKNILIPQNGSQRKVWLLRKLLQSNNPLNVYDLSNQLFINEVELRKEIQGLEKELSDFNLTLNRLGDNYEVIGKESEKRKLLSASIYKELKGTILTSDIIQKNFPTVKVNKVKDMLISSLKDQKFKIDKFDFNNLLLHIVIMINRGNKRNETIDSNLKIVNDIVNWIKTNENINLSENDVHQLEEMFLLLSNKEIKIKDDSKIENLFNKIIGFVRRTYDLNLNEKLFKKRFLPHLIRLIQRYKSNSSIHNPLMKNIKESSPTIYECACLIAYAIKESYGIEISEEEIAFIALHVGNSVAEQIEKENKITCQLYMSDYHGNVARLINRISARFGDDLILLDTVSEVKDILSSTQLVIVVDSNQLINNHFTVYISNFLLASDITKLQKAIREIKLSNRSKKLKSGLQKFTSAKNFYIDNKHNDYQTVISKLADKMKKEGIVGSDFKQKLFEREKISSTAFGLVAIPHAIDYDSKSSQWFIYMNHKGVSWLGQTVYLVFVLAYSSEDDEEFRKLFNELSYIMIDDKRVIELLNSKNYDDFVNKITQ